MHPFIESRRLNQTAQALVARALTYKFIAERLANALRTGAKFIIEDRCEYIDDQTIRVYSNSGEIYLTSLTDCANQETGETCPAFAKGFPCKHRAALFLVRKLTEGDEGGEHQCSNEGCGRCFHIESLRPVDRRRLDAGSVVPSGECPVCRFYCYPIETESATSH